MFLLIAASNIVVAVIKYYYRYIRLAGKEGCKPMMGTLKSVIAY